MFDNIDYKYFKIFFYQLIFCRMPFISYVEYLLNINWRTNIQKWKDLHSETGSSPTKHV